MLFLISQLCFHLCCASVLFSSLVASGKTQLFRLGSTQSYELKSTITLNELSERKGKDLSYQIEGDVNVGVIWQNDLDTNEKLLQIELLSPELLIKTKNTHSSNVFEKEKSELKNTKNFPFLVHWKNGKIISIYLSKSEETSLSNVKKGIASLFQFQVVDTEVEETDVSGNCLVIYKSIDPFSFSKFKSNCASPKELPLRNNSDPVLRANVVSSRTSTYKLSQDLLFIESVTTFESHDLKMIVKNDIGASISVTQYLTFTAKKFNINILKSKTIEESIEEFEKVQKLTLSKDNLILKIVSPSCNKEDCTSLPKILKENREHLSSSSIGTFKSANAFVKLLSAARISSKNELVKAFKGTKNKEILNQLCDLAGAIQLPESHEVIMKILNFDSKDDFSKIERYLWSLATGSHPHPIIVKDIFKVSKQANLDEKLQETLVLTLSAMAHKLSKVPGNQDSTILKDIRKHFLSELELCKDDNCKVKYLKALKNLKCPKTISVLIKQSLDGNSKTSVEALKALRSFNPIQWSDDVLDTAQKIYFQAGRKYDSSSRTLALDILLDSKPRLEILEEILLSLTEYEPMFEVKQYLAQRIKQISLKDEKFLQKINSITKKYYYLFNNYNVRALRGLSTVFDRNFANNKYRNGSLSVTIEISKGVMKRGLVDVEIIYPEGKTTLFTLGLFAKGLTSFVSSDDEKDESYNSEEEDLTTAGMELSIMGVEIRPFIFFSGQSELMGHVWSGTASEKTPAFQAHILVIDHLEYIGLQNGFLTTIQVLGGVSFDLSGQIQISLWNRNAHSLVEKIAGISLQGQIIIDSSFIKSKVEFDVTTELKLNLQSDINFYSETSLCMQLLQPESVIKYKVIKARKIPGGRNWKSSKYSQETESGRSYALNKKNNEMCKIIFSE